MRLMLFSVRRLLNAVLSRGRTAADHCSPSEKLIKRFGKRAVLCGISLDVASGEFLTILGESGSGKTTLLRLIAGFEATGWRRNLDGRASGSTKFPRIGAR